eukprot:267488-Amphidinium_carterae.2
MLVEVRKDVGTRRERQPEGLKSLPHGGQSNVHVVRVGRAQVVHLQLAGTFGHRRGKSADESDAKGMQLFGAEVQAPRGVQQASQYDGRPSALLCLGGHREWAEPLCATQEIAQPVLLPLLHRSWRGHSEVHMVQPRSFTRSTLWTMPLATNRLNWPTLTEGPVTQYCDLLATSMSSVPSGNERQIVCVADEVDILIAGKDSDNGQH